MELKIALLKTEKNAISNFLEKFSLQYDFNSDVTVFIEDENKIVGTVSKTGNVIKCLAVDEDYQQDNLSSKLITKIIEILNNEGQFHYLVYTKKIYENIFLEFGFNTITKGINSIFLEGGSPNIFSEIQSIKKKLTIQYGQDIFKSQIGSIVMNANPITNGHLHLIEKASKENDLVIVFILEEDQSYFSFKERFALAYAAISPYNNVVLIPSTKYIISKETFPNYFLKEVNIHAREYSLIDTKIFKEYFMKELSIDYRYVGTETDPLMKIYNDTLKDQLGEKLIIVERISEENNIISASLVRKMIKDNDIENALIYLPKSIHWIIKSITYEKK